MQTLAAVETRIRTAESLRSIVGTMRTLALVNTRRFERAATALGDYSKPVRLALHICVSALEQDGAVPKAATAEGDSVAVVLGTDHGLCGQFNDRILSFADEATGEGKWSMLVMGQRLADRMVESGYNVLQVVETPGTVETISLQARRLLLEIVRLQQQGRCCRLRLIYNELLTTVRYRETQTDLLPFDPGGFRTLPTDEPPFTTLPQHSPAADQLLNKLLPEYFLAELCLAIAHSLASENSARLMAMEGASSNIDERLERLTEEYNRRRQDEITTELMDIITGTEAVKSAGS